jgi:hypothetical protein
MEQKYNFVGTWQRVGNKLSKEGLEIYIKTRSNPTPQKPHNFIILIDQAKQFHYISSLYPKGANEYTFDYLQQTYDVKFKEVSAAISIHYTAKKIVL